VPVNIGDIWVLEDSIIVNMPEAGDAQIIPSRPILAVASCHIDVRKGHITFEGQWRYAVFGHMKEKVVSPNSSLLDESPPTPDFDCISADNPN